MAILGYLGLMLPVLKLTSEDKQSVPAAAPRIANQLRGTDEAVQYTLRTAIFAVR